jgi:peroxiredoxin
MRHNNFLQKCFSARPAGQWVLVALLVLSAVPVAAWAARNFIADPAPDFALKTLSGENLRLSEYRGDVVMVNFWAVRCGRCRDQLQSLDELYTQNRERGVQFLSVNIDQQSDAIRDMVTTLDLQGPVLLDVEKKVSRLYKLTDLPLMLMIDYSGTVRYVHSGFHRGDEAAYADELENLLAE